MLTIEKAKEELDCVSGWVGNVWSEIFVTTDLEDTNIAILIPISKPKWRRYISWNKLVDFINSGKEIDYHSIGYESKEADREEYLGSTTWKGWKVDLFIENED